MKREEITATFLSIIFGLLAGALFLIATGKNPITTYYWMLYGAWGSPKFIAEMLTRSTPLILTGLALAIGFRAGVFNIGAEGQLLFGGITAAIVGAYFPLPPIIHPVVALLAGMVGGAILGFIPGWLKVKRGLNEVVVTILMNYLVIYFTNYLVRGPFKYGYLPRTKPVLVSAQLPVIFPSTRLHFGFILAVIIALFFHFLIRKTVWGYNLMATGYNYHAAAYGGVNTNFMIIQALMISGALAGLAGSVEILGLHHRFYGQFSPGYGFDGIMVALIGRNDPVGVVFSAILLATLRTGSGLIQLKANVSKEIVWILQALIIIFVAISSAYRMLFEKKKVEI